jgi:hypothetical protein
MIASSEESTIAANSWSGCRNSGVDTCGVGNRGDGWTYRQAVWIDSKGAKRKWRLGQSGGSRDRAVNWTVRNPSLLSWRARSGFTSATPNFVFRAGQSKASYAELEVSKIRPPVG